jgi:hypothetical protein
MHYSREDLPPGGPEPEAHPRANDERADSIPDRRSFAQFRQNTETDWTEEVSGLIIDYLISRKLCGMKGEGV